MAKGHPDYLRTVQDPTGKTGAKVDAGGFLAVGAINGSGFIGSVGVNVNSVTSVSGTSTAVASWTNADTTKQGKYNYLVISCDDDSVFQEIELWNDTTNTKICRQFYVGSATIPLDGFVVEGTDTIKARIYNNAATTKNFRLNIYVVEIIKT